MIAFFGFSPLVQRIEWEFPKLLIRVRFSAGLLKSTWVTVAEGHQMIKRHSIVFTQYYLFLTYGFLHSSYTILALKTPESFLIRLSP